MERKRLQFDLKIDQKSERAFSGYASVFSVVDAYGDVIEPGAFKQTLADAKANNRWPPMLSQHGGMLGGADDVPIGVWTELEEDSRGLHVAGVLADTPRGDEYYKLMRMAPRPAINGMSIGYIAKKWEPRTKPDDPRRRLQEISLHEISLVTFPANDQARVTEVKTIRDAEVALRDAGFSAAEAKAIASRGFGGLSDNRLRDAAAEDLQTLVASFRRGTQILKSATE